MLVNASQQDRRRCWWLRTLSAEELARDVQSLAADNDNLLAVQQLLGDNAGQTAQQVALAINDNLEEHNVSKCSSGFSATMHGGAARSASRWSVSLSVLSSRFVARPSHGVVDVGLGSRTTTCWAQLEVASGWVGREGARSFASFLLPGRKSSLLPVFLPEPRIPKASLFLRRESKIYVPRSESFASWHSVGDVKEKTPVEADVATHR